MRSMRSFYRRKIHERLTPLTGRNKGVFNSLRHIAGEAGRGTKTQITADPGPKWPPYSSTNVLESGRNPLAPRTPIQRLVRSRLPPPGESPSNRAQTRAEGITRINEDRYTYHADRSLLSGSLTVPSRRRAHGGVIAGKRCIQTPWSLRAGAYSPTEENQNSQTVSMLRGLAQQLRAGR